jgi:hypothetical protein
MGFNSGFGWGMNVGFGWNNWGWNNWYGNGWYGNGWEIMAFLTMETITTIVLIHTTQAEEFVFILL